MRRAAIRKLLLSASAIGLVVPVLAAQPARLGSEFRVNTYTTNAQFQSHVAVDGQGNFVVVWTSIGQDGSGYGVFGQRFDASGKKLGSEFQVNTYTTNGQLHPRLGFDATGNFVVVWPSGGQDGSGYGIFGQRFDASATKVGPEFQINTYTTNDQDEPDVAVDGQGNFVVVWTSVGQDGSGYGIFGQRFDASATKVGAEFAVNTYTTSDQFEPHVAVDGQDRFVVVWTSIGQDGSGYGIFGQRFDASGSKAGPEFQINTYTTGDQAQPNVAVDGQGNFAVVWHSVGQDGSGYGIFGQRFDASGARRGGEAQVNTATAGDQRRPALAIAPDGRTVVTWTDQNGDGPGNIGVVGQAFDRTGTKSGPPFSVNTYTTGSQYSWAVALDRSGRFVVVWNSLGQDGSIDGVFGQRFALTSNFYTLTPCRVLDTRNPVGPYGGPALAALADRTFVLTGQCGIPAGATGVSINVTVTQPTAAGDLRIFPASTSLPLVSTINYGTGQTRANNAIAILGPAGDLTVHSDQPSGTTHFILDVNGYYQ